MNVGKCTDSMNHAGRRIDGAGRTEADTVEAGFGGRFVKDHIDLFEQAVPRRRGWDVFV